jgi:hypothetical protein
MQSRGEECMNLTHSTLHMSVVFEPYIVFVMQIAVYVLFVASHIFSPEHGGSIFLRNVNVYRTEQRHIPVHFHRNYRECLPD